MRLLFVDESGNPTSHGKKGTDYFVLGGVVVPDGIWHKIEQKFNQLKKQYSVTGEIKWRYFSPYNGSTDNSLLNLDGNQKKQLRIDLLTMLTSFNCITIISVLCHTPSCYSKLQLQDDEAIYHRAYKVLSERFQYYLQDSSRASGDHVNGLVICDHRNSRSDKRLRDLHASLVFNPESRSINYKNIIEGLLLAPSHHSIGIQFADLVAGAIYRKYSAKDSTHYDLIKPAIRRSPTDQSIIRGYGVSVLPTDYQEVQ